ncbi:MAG TPA: LLM class flavin-dependent oxidoreductase, partial [Candidatus Limnocylindrales bacterium]|nr:LLM class flavin-dependent oxidoreductase [Candidatus Limnocylindrales bacterium]
MNPPVRFGLFLGQGNRSWDEIVARFRLAEELGYDHAMLIDHLVDTDGPPSAPIHEAWTTIAALATLTSRIRLGVLVTSNTFRHPSVLAKQAVTVDHISGGRLILGLGAGWHEDEHRRYGIELPPPGERIDRFEEAVELISSLMANERTTFAGRHYRLDDAPLEPRPVQRPRIPILIAAHRPRMIGIAARFADQWDTFPEVAGTATEGVQEGIAARVERFEAAARAAGRDPAKIRRSTWAEADVAIDEDRFVAFVRTYRELGFTDFATVLPAPERIGALRRIAERV